MSAAAFWIPFFAGVAVTLAGVASWVWRQELAGWLSGLFDETPATTQRGPLPCRSHLTLIRCGPRLYDQDADR